MKYFLKVITICSLALILGNFYTKNVKAEDSDEVEAAKEEFYLFVREGCPHCKDVENFIEENNILEYVAILDVEADPLNAELYNTKFEEASVPVQDRGSVPVMFEGAAYFIGSDEIMLRLGERFGIEVDIDSIENPEEEKSTTVIIIIFAVAVIISAGFLFLNKRNEK